MSGLSPNSGRIILLLLLVFVVNKLPEKSCLACHVLMSPACSSC